MADREKIIKGLETCRTRVHCKECPYAYDKRADDSYCEAVLHNDVLALLKEQDEEHRRLVSWLGRFCRHIDNGDAWLTDEENIAFFKEKMKQQFGWNTD